MGVGPLGDGFHPWLVKVGGEVFWPGVAEFAAGCADIGWGYLSDHASDLAMRSPAFGFGGVAVLQQGYVVIQYGSCPAIPFPE